MTGAPASDTGGAVFSLPASYLTDSRLPLRLRLWLAAAGRCYWCCRLMTTKRRQPHAATVEHLRPRCDGGTDRRDNLALACRRCNGLRGHLPHSTFAGIVAAFGDTLPEIGTPAFTALNATLRQLEKPHHVDPQQAE